MHLQQQQKPSPSVRNSIPTEDTTCRLGLLSVTYLIPMHGELPRYGDLIEPDSETDSTEYRYMYVFL